MIAINRFIGVLLAVALLAFAGCAGTETSRSTGTYIDDKTITAKVEAGLAADSITNAIKIDIETYQGVVQLSGFVNNQAAIDRAVEIAKGVEGVKEVKNNLNVR